MAGKGSKFKESLFRFVWGPEVELGDCIFYTILTLVLLGLVWLFTFERIGIHVGFVFIPWAAIVYAIWKQYVKHNSTKDKEHQEEEHRG